MISINKRLFEEKFCKNNHQQVMDHNYVKCHVECLTEMFSQEASHSFILFYEASFPSIYTERGEICFLFFSCWLTAGWLDKSSAPASLSSLQSEAKINKDDRRYKISPLLDTPGTNLSLSHHATMSSRHCIVSLCLHVTLHCTVLIILW